MLSTAAALVVAAGCTTTVPGTPVSLVSPRETIVFAQTALQDGVRQILVDKYMVAGVQDVTCPAHARVEAGTTFDCTVTIDGEPRSVTVTVKNADGAYEVSQPKDTSPSGTKVFDQGALQDGVKKIVMQYDPSTEVESVTCPANQPVQAGTTFDCGLSLGGAQPRETTVTVTVKDDNGTYEVGQPKQ